jgi:glycosyltransferase involved in cell wall biosynthesis
MKLDIAILHHYSMTLNHGGEKIIKSIAINLNKRGHSAFVYSLPFRRRKDNVPFFPFCYKECFFKRFVCDVAYFVYVPLLHRVFRTSAPKIAGIHSFITWPSFSHERISFPLIFYRHGGLACGAIYFSLLTRNKDLNSFNAIHVPNIVMPNRINNIPIYTIPNWVDLRIFRPRKTKNDVFTITFVGSEEWSKGYDIFCEIAKYLHKAIPKINFKAIGIQNNKSPSFIETHPFIYHDDLLADIYSSSHILIHPSRADIFGITLIESLACGTPVLTSALPSHQAFLPLSFICFNLHDYISKVLKIYQAWYQKSGEYELLVNEAKDIASRFDKEKIFPLFERMLVEVASNQGG